MLHNKGFFGGGNLLKLTNSAFERFAFTLAEVLITLGIIGVVAAMTIPTMITNYQKHVVETKLTKFNSTLNQALRMSSAENGDPDAWVTQNKNYTYNENVEFLHTYFFPYIKYLHYVPCSNDTSNVCITLLDGIFFRFRIDGNGGDITYFLDGDVTRRHPRNSFQFQFTKKSGINLTVNSTSFVEPYIYSWNGTMEHLKNGNTWACKRGCTNCGYCTKLIQLNGWKIPKDYPW